MMNMQNMMKQAQKLQKQMEKSDALGQIDEATKKSMGAFAGKLPF